MRIGVNALYLIPGQVGGTEIYLRCLLEALAGLNCPYEFFVFMNRETDAGLVPQHPNFHAVRQPLHAAFRPARLLWEQVVLPVQVRRLRLDVLLNPGFTAPFLACCPNVTVFHDLQHKRHPEYFRWFELPFWRFFLYWSARRSRRIIAISEATRADVVHYYRLDGARLDVVPHGVEDVFFEIGRERRPDQLERMILCVSTLHPHKNLDRLVRVFKRLHERHPQFRLVIAGMQGFQTAAVEGAIAACNLADHVTITGWIPRSELLDLYRRAWAFVFPSLFEGFGLPVLEALACGVPAAVSDIAPIRDIAGSAALRFDPYSEEAMLDALLRLIDDEPLRRQLCAQGPVRAAAFSWRAAAQQTLRVLEQAGSRQAAAR